MKNIYFTFCFVLIVNLLSAQRICFDIDSIRVTSIPLSLKSKISLGEDEIRNFDTTYKKEKVIKDSIKINDFSDIDLKSSELVNTKTSIDVKIVMDIYLNNGLVINICLDNYGNYRYGDMLFFRNEILLDWILKNGEVKYPRSLGHD